MRRFVIAGIFGISFFRPLASPACGQSILVQVTESESGRPIAGAFVSLLNEEGRTLRSALTNGSGLFLFPVPGPGVYRAKAEMIGKETRVSTPFTVREDESGRISLSLPVHAIPLAGIEVEADERCRLRPDEASEIARVWEEARKALAVQAWAEEEGLYRMEISTYERNLDATGRRVEGERRNASTAVTRTPFVSLPPGDIMTGGFVRPLEGGGHQYYGPDAPVLLSDLFLDSHCFRLTRSGDLPGSIGLSFEPVGEGDIPDIEGTLWLDQETARLQHLEYGYTWAPYREAQGVAGGRVEFQPMPNGAWIIDRWWIRAPAMTRYSDLVRGSDSGIRVAGIIETGGEVTSVETLDRQRVSEIERGSLTGLVWDSTQVGPLPAATVYLSGTQYAGVTDANGRFLIEGLPAGVFTAGFTHPRLDTLGVFPPGREVHVVPGEISELRLGVPSMETILLASCRAVEEESGGAVLSGVVRNETSGEPIPGATVRLEWQEVQQVRPVIAKNEWMEVWTDTEGRYTACGLPLDEAVFVSARMMEARSEVVKEAGFKKEEHRILDLDVELPPGLFSAPGEGRTWVEEYGAQGVQGTLTEPGSGEPIRSAEVTLRDASGRVRVSGITNEKGFFRLQTPVPGRYLFSARALGFAEVSGQAIEVSLGKLAVLEVQMAPEALELEPLVVMAEARPFHLEMEGFYERQARSASGGIFMAPEFLERRKPRRVTDVFFGLAGTQVMEPQLGAGPRAVYFRSGVRLNSICWPMVYIDSHLVSTGGLAGADPTALDEFVHAQDVAAIEVYRSPAEVPSEFNGPNAGCGVVVVWTRRGGGR